MNSLFKNRNRFHSPAPAARGWIARWGLVAGLLAACAGSLAADGSVSAVQESLRREQLLSGEPSGVLDDKTRAALRRFQVRRDLPVTGEIDPGTLLALERDPSTAPAQSRESVAAALAEATVERDREFLKQVESDPAQIPPRVVAPAAASGPIPGAPAAIPASVGAAGSESSRREPDPGKNRSPEKRHESLEPGDAEPDATARPAPARTTTSDADADPLDSHGTRIIRTTTVNSGPEKRRSTPEKKTITRSTKTAVIEVRRAEAVDPRRKAPSLLHRFFDDE